MKVRYHVLNITSFMTFANVKGGINQDCKDVYFVRCIGHYNKYIDDLEKIDQLLSQRENSGQGKYIRESGLSKLENLNDIKFYSNVYHEWERSGRKVLKLNDMVINKELEITLNSAFEKLMNTFLECSLNVSESIQKNFFVKIMYWLDTSFGTVLSDWKVSDSYKYIVSGITKKQEYLFLYFLTLLGIDVMVLLPEGDLNLDKSLMDLSYQLQLAICSDITIHEYDKSKYKNREIKSSSEKVNIHRNDTERNKKEKDFEELARLSSSVVLISMHDNHGDVFATGSGIIISEDGYILTNSHVASGGRYYSIKIEDDQETYGTDEVIKNNSFLDLTLIRIDKKKLNPIPIYQGSKELVRGQKVLAIGSPLGMFNSVSDGIISGFRNINDVEMIQFTAPISHGSSGGALLNMRGEVIGISTAGIDSGQNINLAVNYQDITRFLQGFL